jgi:hypothetical protein
VATSLGAIVALVRSPRDNVEAAGQDGCNVPCLAKKPI